MPVKSCTAGCSVEIRVTVLVSSREPNAVAASLAAELGRSGVALRRSPQVRGSVAVRSNVVTPFALRVVTSFGDAYSF